MARSDNPLDRISGSPWPTVPLWFAMLAPPAMALTHVLLGYPLEHTSCATQSLAQVHILTVILLSIIAVAGFIARREWLKYGAENPGQTPAPVGTRRFMALIAMIGSVLFFCIVLVQWIPTAFLPPCIRT